LHEGDVLPRVGAPEALAEQIGMLQRAGMLPLVRPTREKEADIRNSYGAALAKEGDFDHAEEQFRRALELNASLAAARHNLQLLALKRAGSQQ
ncbi:MAG: hypothetical protein ACOY3P_17780, partial [Planctomycetota bacterium]